MADDLPLAFLGTYPPRRCGIATFTRDLREAVESARGRIQPVVVAMTDPVGRYDYPKHVRYEIRQGVKGDYARAAEFLNFSDVRLLFIQHEHGIFGGDDGAYILDLLATLRVPSIVTLHTVLRSPSESQRSIVERMAEHAGGVVVMSRVAVDLLDKCYGVRGSKVRLIPHGIPALAPRDPNELKARFGVFGKRMLLTFGLLGPNKGIETMIRALPRLVSDRPDLVYFVVGATHPVIVRQQGEAYRTSLEREAERLGVRGHVVFRDQFVTAEELADYLQAADVFVSPYLNEAQVTSGALSHAMGAGAAVVSTPYWHAAELLADGRGRLFPFGDSDALAEVLASLLDHPAELEKIRASAHAFTRAMTWPRIGKDYLELATRVIADAPVRPLRAKSTRASALPELRLDHLLRLTDDTGIIQHATYSVPARQSGYCVDDNARALIVAVLADRLGSSPDTKTLVTTYLSFLQSAQLKDGTFANLVSYGRVLDAGSGSEDCIGRAMWALGTCVHLAADEGCRRLAREMFERCLPRTQDFGPRGAAFTILGLSSFLHAVPDSGAQETLDLLAKKLIARYQREATDDWRWFEPTLTYDNAIVPLALFKASMETDDPQSQRIARESLEFLEKICFDGGQLALVGNDGWHKRGEFRSRTDEQAIDAAAFVLAFRAAWLATREDHYLQRMRESFAWFLGANRLALPLYDFITAGCRDGLGPALLNQNEGAESTLSFLLSLLEMLELAGEGLEHAGDP